MSLCKGINIFWCIYNKGPPNIYHIFFWHTCTVNAQNHLSRALTWVNGINIIIFDYLTILNIKYKSVTKSNVIIFAIWETESFKGEAVKSTQKKKKKICCKIHYKFGAALVTTHNTQMQTTQWTGNAFVNRLWKESWISSVATVLLMRYQRYL